MFLRITFYRKVEDQNRQIMDIILSIHCRFLEELLDNTHLVCDGDLEMYIYIE